MSAVVTDPTAVAAPVINDCWRRIGVRGNRSCEHLAAHVHCRNCPVYSSVARRVLDAPVAQDRAGLAAQHFAQSVQKTAAGTHSITIFRVQSEWLALPTVQCREVASMRSIHSLPHRRSGAVLGLANIRGELLVCVSLAAILGLAASEARATGRNTAQRLLVVNGSGAAIVFPVDEVHGVQRLHPQEVKETPATVAKAQATYTRGIVPVTGKYVGLLDEQLLFYSVDRSLA